MRILITGAGGSAASNFFDSLSISDLEFEAIGVDSSAPMLHLSRMGHKQLVPSADSPVYVNEINAISKKYGCSVLHAQPDAEVRRLSLDRDLLSTDVFLPEHKSVELASDKEEFSRIMRLAGVSVPDSYPVHSMDETYQVCENMLKVYPKLWVRARRGAGSRASLPVSSGFQAVGWIKWWIDEKGFSWSDFQISEFLPGEEYALQTIWQDGNLIAAEARVRLKYFYGFLSPSGQSSTPSVARTTSKPEVYDVGINAIKKLDARPNGIFCVDMKTNIEQKIKVTEINAGRFFTTSNFFAHAGVNMPVMSVRAAMGYKLKPVQIASLGEDLFWIRMVDMGYKLAHRSELDEYVGIRDL